MSLILLAGSPGCRHQQSGDPELESLLETLTAEALADAAGACTAGTASGVRTLEVRATSESSVTYCDLLDGSRVESVSAANWDMSFQRFKLGTNSGTSGSGLGGACKTGSSDFAAVTSLSAFTGTVAPDCPMFSTDVILDGSSVGGGSVQFSGSAALKDWYLYNIFTHALTARQDVYIVRSSDGAKYYKVQMLDYYSAAGVSGYPKLRLAEIAP